MCCPLDLPHRLAADRPHSIRGLGKKTYTRQLGTAVTALGSGSTLLDVQDTQLTTGRLDDTGPVGGGVVAGGENFLSVLRVLLLCTTHLDPSHLNLSWRESISPVTASVGNTVARHFDGLA